MTSYEFEKAAKRAVVYHMKERHCLNVAFENLQLVWFGHVLGNKKCLLYAPELEGWYLEVTYNENMMVFYVDAYRKVSKIMITCEAIAHLQQDKE